MNKEKLYLAAYLSLLLIIALLSNCSQSSDPEPPAFLLEGNWTLINITSTGCSNPSLNGNNNNFACPPATELQVCSIYSFSSKNELTETLTVKYKGTLNVVTSSGTYSLKGNQLTATTTSSNGGDTSTSFGTASLSGNTLIIKWSKNSSSSCETIYTLNKS